MRWRVGPLPTTLLENLELVTIALYVVLVARERRPLPFRTPLDIPVALFVIAAIIGIAVSPDHRGALGVFRAYLLEPIALFYVSVALLRTEGSIYRLLTVWGVGAVLFSVVEVVTFSIALLTHRLVPSYAAAAFGINANSVALYLEPLIGLAAGVALFGQGRRRAGAIVALLFLLPAEFATLSRGGLLAVAALALIAIVTVRAPRVRIPLLTAAALGAVAALTLPVIGPRVTRGFDPVWGTFQVRGRIWAATLRMLRDHPIFGAGLNSYQSVMAPYIKVDRNLVPEPYPHNIFLTAWTETGILGLVAFTWILGVLIVRPWRAFRRAAADQRPLLWGTAAAFTMLLVHGLVDSPYWKNDLSLEFWVLAAIDVVSLRIVYNSSPAG